MKKSFQLAALLTIFSIVSCVAQQKDSTASGRASLAGSVTLSPIPDISGVAMELYQQPSARAIVRVYDGHHDIILVDRMPANPFIYRRYLLPDDGEYTFVVEIGDEKFTKKINVKSQTSQLVTINN